MKFHVSSDRMLNAILHRSMSFLLLMIFSSAKTNAQSILPEPDHIVVVFLENHAFSQIIGSEFAPFINMLANDQNTALFTRSFGIEHPSQPNYLDFYSGSNQGVTNNDIPQDYPFKTPNLGRQLSDSLYSFISYSEDLPYAGFDGASFDSYVRKHNPVANWIGSDTNQMPEAVNQPFTAFPSTDYNLLPTVSFVIPNQSNNMHDGSDPSRIVNADTWLSENLNNYIEWSKTNNSLFILTFDEDDYANNNQIVTIFTGRMVNSGLYADTINHFSVLRTIEDMYGLPYAGKAAEALPVTTCWKSINDVTGNDAGNKEVLIFPNPAKDEIIIRFDHLKPGSIAKLHILTLTGARLIDETVSGSSINRINLDSILPGIYIVKFIYNQSCFSQKLIVQ